MSLTKRYLRDGKNRIIGSITSGYSDTSSVVRDERDQISDAPTSVSTPSVTHTGTWFQSILPTPVC